MEFRKVVLILLLSLLSNPALTQERESYHLGLQGSMGVPVGNFKEAIKNSFGDIGFGGGFHLLLNPKKEVYSPVLVGLDFNYLNFGKEKIPSSQYFPQLKTTFNYFTIGPMFRVLLSKKDQGIIPFLDGMVGMKIMNSKTKVDNTIVDTLLDEEYLESLLSTNYEGLNTGFGVGIYKKSSVKIPDEVAVSWFIKLMFQYGDQTKFVKRNSVRVDDEGQLTYETGRTQTSLVNLQFGILFRQ